MIGVRGSSPNKRFEIHGYDLTAQSVWHINVLDVNGNGWLQTAQRLGYLPLRVVSNLLSENFERLWGYAEHKPTASAIQERTCRVHPILQFTCSLFQLQMYVLVIGYKPFKFLNVHCPLFLFHFFPKKGIILPYDKFLDVNLQQVGDFQYGGQVGLR